MKSMLDMLGSVTKKIGEIGTPNLARDCSHSNILSPVLIVLRGVRAIREIAII